MAGRGSAAVAAVVGMLGAGGGNSGDFGRKLAVVAREVSPVMVGGSGGGGDGCGICVVGDCWRE